MPLVKESLERVICKPNRHEDMSNAVGLSLPPFPHPGNRYDLKARSRRDNKVAVPIPPDKTMATKGM